MTSGASCDVCGVPASGNPIVTALSNPDGTFTLHDVPVGTNIPLVIQLGKWRRQVTIPQVQQCVDNKLSDPNQTRLPKSQSEGDMPHIALTTGGCDKLGCMLPKVGIATNEFGVLADGPTKAIHVFKGTGGGGPNSAGEAQGFWADVNRMKSYDMIILSCECDESLGNKSSGAFAAMTQYLAAGGRIFTTDFMYTWYKYSPDPGLKGVGNIPGGAPMGDDPMTIDTSFPKGKALSQWLQVVFPTSALAKANQIPFDVVFANLASLDPTKEQTWASSGPITTPRIFTVNTPVGVPVAQQCGKGVHIDAHVNQTGEDTVGGNYPLGCTEPLKEGEATLAFFFFDLAACIQNDGQAPPPPPVR
jgi:hypothetical protein